MLLKKSLGLAVLSASVLSACNDNNIAPAKRFYLAPDSGQSTNVDGADLSSGRLVYSAHDNSSSFLDFSRTYSSQGKASPTLGEWQHNYSNHFVKAGIAHEQWRGSKSALYTSADAACESGWQALKETAYLGQLTEARAIFHNGLCDLYAEGEIVASLPVRVADGDNPYPVHTLIRPDGNSYTFFEKNGQWATTNALPVTLTTSGDGWAVTLPDDSIETYNAAGKLVSINRQGQVINLSYNAAGQLATVVSPFGQTLNLSYVDGKLDKTTSAAGTTSYHYDSDGRLIEVTQPGGSTHQYGYDAEGRLTHITDEMGIVTARYSYDNEGRVITSEAADGTRARRFNYGTDETTVTDVANNTQDAYQFKVVRGMLRLAQTRDADGVGESWVMDANGYPTSALSRTGQMTQSTYDARGLMIARTTDAQTPNARTTLTEWHTNFRQPIRQIEPGKIAFYDYDDQGRRIRELSGSMLTAARTLQPVTALRNMDKTALRTLGTDVQETLYTYNAQGQLATTTAPNGGQSSVSYDAQGQAIANTNALGQASLTLERDAAGRALKTRAANGQITTQTYDAAGRLLTVTSNGQVTRYEYDATGRQTQVSFPDGSTQQSVYDAAGNLISTVNSDGDTTRYTYDSNGNQLTETVSDVSGRVLRSTTNEYNKRNQLIKTTNAAGESTTYGYDRFGNQTIVTDAKGRVTQQAYDTAQRLVKMTNPAGGVTEYRYDSAGNRVAVIMPNGATTRYTYDAFNRLLSESSPDRGTTTYTYDASGNQTSMTDANGNTTRHTYDLLNRKTQTTWADGRSASWRYDDCAMGIGRLCGLSDARSSLSYQYDSEGRMTQTDQVVDGVLLRQSFTYTAEGKRASHTLPSGTRIDYSYTRDKLTGLSINGQPYLSDIRYNANGQITGWQWPDGSTHQKTYDASSRLSTLPLGNIIRTLNYDAVGNLTGWDDTGDAAATKQFRYDELNRLIDYTASGEAQTFEYDANGNRTLKTDGDMSTAYQIAANSNRLTQVGNTLQTLDDNGNLLDDGENNYTYDAQNRLIQVNTANGTTRYTYNANEQRVKKSSPDSTTLYLWQNDRIIGEYDANGQAEQETIYFGSTPVALIKDNQTYRIEADQLDTPRVISDQSGDIVWRWDSAPFGETLPDEDPDQDGLKLTYNARFPGQLYDAETGLHYNFHRDYDPQSGRYVQSDPIGLGGGGNTFGYAALNPAGFYDNSGLAYRKHNTIGHGDLYVRDNIHIEGFILDLPNHAMNGFNAGNYRCKKISSSDGFSTVCAGSGLPPFAIGPNNQHGDLDMFRVSGQWYKISGVHEVKYRFGYSSLGIDINAIGGPYPRFALEADAIYTQAAYYFFRDKEWYDAINYINRIKREVNSSIPGA